MIGELQGILIPFIGTTLGSACALFMKKELNPMVQRVLAAFAAGVMVAASVWSLLIPEMSQGQHSNLGTIFFTLGFTLMIDGFTPFLFAWVATSHTSKMFHFLGVYALLRSVLSRCPPDIWHRRYRSGCGSFP